MTTIAISEEVKERLRATGKKGETYEKVLVKLLDSYDKRKEPVGNDRSII